MDKMRFGRFSLQFTEKSRTLRQSKWGSIDSGENLISSRMDKLMFKTQDWSNIHTEKQGAPGLHFYVPNYSCSYTCRITFTFNTCFLHQKFSKVWEGEGSWCMPIFETISQHSPAFPTPSRTKNVNEECFFRWVIANSSTSTQNKAQEILSTMITI